MTKRQLRRATFIAMGIYSLAFLVGLVLRMAGPPTPTPYYETFKDLIPFILATPAAYLGYCFQQRGSYLESLRSIWSKLVSVINHSIHYTFKEVTSEEEYFEILNALGCVIDEIRGTYKNIKERPGHIGLYPYEPIKTIYKEVRELGFGPLSQEKRGITRQRIVGHWKSIRENFLAEFDRSEPTEIVSPYVEK